MSVEYNPKDDLLIQTYLTTNLLYELNNLNFLESEYYKNAEFVDKSLHQFLPTIGIGNRGTLLITLYSLLIIPKELIQEKHEEEFKSLNNFVYRITSHAMSNYESDFKPHSHDKDITKDLAHPKDINYIRHIRNSVAHADVVFTPENEITFLDKSQRFDWKNKKQINETCEITIPLSKIDSFIYELKKIFFKHIDELKETISRE